MRGALIAAVLTLAGCDAQWGDYGASAGPAQSDSFAVAPADLPSFFDCLRENSATIVSAHRGGWRLGMPENAISTFASAVANDPVFLEIDVRATRDGALVVMHDDSVDRTTDGSGALAHLTLAQVQAFNLHDEAGRVLDEHPPSLREALDWAAGKTVLELDIKQDVRFEDVIEEVRAANAMGRVVFVTYSVPAAARFAQLAPEAMLYVTVRSADDLDELEQRGVDLAHVVAWTGDEEPNSELNVALAQRGVEARFGMFAETVMPRQRNGQPVRQVAAFADTGLQIIVSDSPGDAVIDLDEHDGVEGYGALQCVAAD